MDLHDEQNPEKVERTHKQRSNISRNQLESIFKELENKVITLLKKELERYKMLLSPDYPACSERVEEEEDQSSIRKGVLKITLHVLKNMKQTDLANTLQNKLISVHQPNLKSRLREKCKRITEGISHHGSSSLLNEIYTELYVTEGWSGEINNEHEVRQIEKASRRPATQEKPIKCNEIVYDVTESSQCIFIEEFGLERKVFSFVHLSVQEFLAALFICTLTLLWSQLSAVHSSGPSM